MNNVDVKQFELEIDENDLKSMKSEANFKYKAKMSGVPDLSKVKESIDRVGVSKTDDKVAIGASKVSMNPKLETTKGAELGALAATRGCAHGYRTSFSFSKDRQSVRSS